MKRLKTDILALLIAIPIMAVIGTVFYYSEKLFGNYALIFLIVLFIVATIYEMSIEERNAKESAWRIKD